MLMKEKIEEKIHKTERHLIELSIHIQRLRKEYQELIDELNLNSEELHDFTTNPENFPPALWEDLQRDKKLLDERLDLALNQVSNMNKTQQTISERGKIQQHWMLVR